VVVEEVGAVEEGDGDGGLGAVVEVGEDVGEIEESVSV
jgi:hypothetical protein